MRTFASVPIAWRRLAVCLAATLAISCGEGRIEETPVLPSVEALEEGVAAKLRQVHSQAVADPSARNWARYARTLHAHEMGREAVPVYLLAAERSEIPEKFEHLYLAGFACVDQEPERAVELFEQALKLRGDYVPLHLRLARVHEAAHRFGDARRHFRRALEPSPEHMPSNAALAGLGRVDLAEGRLSEAIEVLERARAIDPEQSEIHVALAVAYARSGRKQDAARASASAGDVKHPHDFMDPIAASMCSEGVSYRTLEAFGTAAFRTGRFQEALDLFNRALAVRPDHPDALAGKANVLLSLGRTAEADSIAERVLAMRPGNVDALMLRAACAMSRNEVPAAISWLRRAVEINPRHLALRVDLGRALRHANQLAEAKDQLRFVLQRSDRRVDARLELASILADERKNDEAMVELGQVLLAEPSNKRALALRERLSK